MIANTKTTLQFVMKIFDEGITMLKLHERAEDKRNNSYRGQEPKKLHKKAKVAIKAQGCASTRCKAKI